MNAYRNMEILTAGLEAAWEQMQKHPARPDYPRDFDRLYEWLEDKVFSLYEAVRLKNISHIKTVAGDIIVTSSEVIEYAGKAASAQEKKKFLIGRLEL